MCWGVAYIARVASDAREDHGLLSEPANYTDMTPNELLKTIPSVKLEYIHHTHRKEFHADIYWNIDDTYYVQVSLKIYGQKSRGFRYLELLWLC